VGFYLYREVDGEWDAVHEGLLPGLLDAPQGGVYEFRDDGADASETELYLLVEVDVRGVQSEHGPFVVNFDSAGETLLDRDAGYTRQAHQLAPLGTSLKAATSEKQSGGDPVAIYLGVEETGLYAVSAAEIAARFGITEASVQSRIQTGELLLTEAGETVAWSSSTDGLALQFFGVERQSLFTSERIYRLSLATGSTMTERSAAPGAITGGLTFESDLHLEEDLIPALVISQDPDSDYWFWQLISAEPLMPQTAAVTFQLEAIAGDGMLEVDLHGIEGEGHSVEVRLNGTPLGTTSFEGVVPHQATFNVPESVMQEGENTVHRAGQPRFEHAVPQLGRLDLYARIRDERTDAPVRRRSRRLARSHRAYRRRSPGARRIRPQATSTLGRHRCGRNGASAYNRDGPLLLLCRRRRRGSLTHLDLERRAVEPPGR